MTSDDYRATVLLLCAMPHGLPGATYGELCRMISRPARKSSAQHERAIDAALRWLRRHGKIRWDGRRRNRAPVWVAT